MTAQRPTVEALAELIEPHITEQTNESGCPLACGFDGDDMAEHIAQRIIDSDLWAESMAQAWDECVEASRQRGYLARTRDEVLPNPYRKAQP